jgi:hypothetical protein
MRAINCLKEDLHKALALVNQKYAGNVAFREIVPNGRGTRFTLKVVDCRKPGHRLGFEHPYWQTKTGKPYKPRRLTYACWHVHGDFFDALFEINPKAKIRARKDLITINGGNWQDTNIGSQMYPQYFSEACECIKEVQTNE